MKNIIFIICAFPSILFAQKYDYIWQMGATFTKTNQEPRGFEMNFNNNITKLRSFPREYQMRNGFASMCDKNGNFLFAVNGCKIFNKEHHIMQNGDSLYYPSGLGDLTCNQQLGKGTIGPQTILALPKPQSDDSLFYIFHQHYDWLYDQQRVPAVTRLEYSIININKNAGLGEVVQKKITFINDTIESGITAVKHANGQDWWLLTKEEKTNRYYTFKLTAQGILQPFSQYVGMPSDTNCSGGNNILFSPNGRKMAINCSLDSGATVFDFDRNTGLLSNPTFLRMPVDLAVSLFTGASFSPNSQFLYLLDGIYIMQFDILANDIQGSRTEVARWNGIRVDGLIPSMAASQLAPDCRIYYSPADGMFEFGYIRYPDRKGVACEVVQRGIDLTKDSVYLRDCMPNVPNYRLGITPTYPCDSTISFRVSTKEALPPLSIILYPNPVGNELNIDYTPDNANGELEIKVFDIVGKTVFNKKFDAFRDPLSINVSNLAEGMYIISISVQGKKTYISKFIKR